MYLNFEFKSAWVLNLDILTQKCFVVRFSLRTNKNLGGETEKKLHLI